MTETEFFAQALLRIAGNSAFGKCVWVEPKAWGKDIERAAAVLLDVAIENHCLESDEPDQPP